MYQLLRKDFGLCRHVLMGATIALLVPYLAVIVYLLCVSGLTSDERVEFFSLGLLGASQTSIWLSMFSIAFLAGFVVAGERRDRSAEFLAFLPPKKSMILFSKALVCAMWMMVVALSYFLVADLIVPWISNGEHAYSVAAREIGIVSAVIFSVFGTSWLASTLLSSPVLAVLAGLGAPYAVGMFVYVLQLQLGWEVDQDSVRTVYMWVFLTFGAMTFSGGWWYFILRIEP